jgi:hypothetical protein
VNVMATSSADSPKPQAGFDGSARLRNDIS